MLSVLSIACIAHADKHASDYTVQIATYRTLPNNFVKSAEEFGEVLTSQAGDLTRVSIGSFNTKDQAQELLSRLRQAGYKDAFIKRTDADVTAHSSHASNSTHHHDHHSLPGSEMEKLRNLSATDKERAVFLDGKLHLKDGNKFILVP